MLTVRDHGVEDYIGLRDMDATDVGHLTGDDRACLEELGQYLVDSDAGERFAMWLLHKHLEPAPGEVFVERTIAQPRRTETTLIDRSEFPGDSLYATAFRFDETVAGVGVIGMEFSEPADLGCTSPLNAHDEAVLAGIVERLQAHDKTERFGVKLIRNPLGLSERELLLETCDSTERALYCDVSDRGSIPADATVIETTWKYRLVQGQTKPIVMQDCTAGCVSVPGGHDVGHAHSGTDNDDNPLP
ncbi:hypothetical protein [Mycolicibacterium hodleri]|uniref:Uncharacterized protein n=1 Tax=Mycolicibacterium hodleri TaxID=49897 RepID=A0A502EG16_9MYCO|nr:hypothetical protein [Mycolicibacterium hodleri]TPG36665.1 hypothetical protein EAH80_01580 [Mycolicibacterium hodleri]